MASIEKIASELEDDYRQIKTSFEKYINSLNAIPTSAKAHKKELSSLLGAVANFQRRIEVKLLKSAILI